MEPTFWNQHAGQPYRKLLYLDSKRGFLRVIYVKVLYFLSIEVMLGKITHHTFNIFGR